MTRKLAYMFISILIVFLSACTDLDTTIITFQTHGGNVIERFIYDKEQAFILPDDPTKEGYTFEGWYTDVRLLTPYLHNEHPERSLTLYAKWSINQYHITFISDHDLDIPNLILDYQSIIDLPLDLFVDDHEFMGWYLDEDFQEPFDVDFMPARDLTLYAHWLYIPNGLPIMEITLMDVELINVNRETYVPAIVSVLNTEARHLLDEVTAEFRGRGNGSWTYDKKGYRIKFESRQSLFGEPSNRHWVLVAGGHDRSAIRNHLAYSIINEFLDGIEYQTSVHLIELYVNGHYHGVYSLFEHVRVDKNRVDIDADFGILDTGYLIEYDSYARGIEGIDYFRIPGLKYPFTVKSPDPDDYHLHVSESVYRAQVAYIRSYILSVYQAVFNQDFETLETLVDMDSVVDMYIIHELFKNTDTGWSSFYMYKKAGGKLYFGPAWDFDFTAGISRGDASFQGLYVSDRIRIASNFTSSEFYIELMKHEAFVNLVKARYLEFALDLHTYIEVLFDEIALYEDAFQRDGERWYINRFWKQEQNNLKNWLLNRNAWLLVWAEEST